MRWTLPLLGLACVYSYWRVRVFTTSAVSARGAQPARTRGANRNARTSTASIGRSIVTRAERNSRALHQAGMIPVSKPKDDDKQPATSEVDERWLGEWIKYGSEQLDKFMKDHAAFDDYCRQRDAAVDGE